LQRKSPHGNQLEAITDHPGRRRARGVGVRDLVQAAGVCADWVAEDARKQLRELQVGSPLELTLEFTQVSERRDAVAEELYRCLAGPRVRGLLVAFRRERQRKDAARPSTSAASLSRTVDPFTLDAREYHASATGVNPRIAEPVSPTQRSSLRRSLLRACTAEQRADQRQQSLGRCRVLAERRQEPAAAPSREGPSAGRAFVGTSQPIPAKTDRPDEPPHNPAQPAQLQWVDRPGGRNSPS
jgi:hypothetical protein